MSRASKILALLLMVAGTTFTATMSTLKVGNRTANVYTPSGYNKPPLVISYHGMGIGAGWNQGMMLFERYADTAKDKFITVYPQGENNVWDLGGTKDINFTLAIIDSMVKRYGVDRNRVYVTGFSMGGMLSWYLSCKIPDKIAAAVPGNGFPLGGMSGCVESRRVPMLHIHGTADDFVKYSQYVGSFGPSQVSRYGCGTPVRTSPYPPNKPNSQSFRETWNPCTKNGVTSQISLIHVTGMIHDWATPGKANANDDTKFKGKPFDIDGTQEAWNFMKQHSLTGSTGLADQARLSGQPVLKALVSEGRLQLESDVALRGVKVLDLQGKVQSVWNADGSSSNTVNLSVGQLTRGVYMLEATGDAGRTVQSVMVP